MNGRKASLRFWTKPLLTGLALVLGCAQEPVYQDVPKPFPVTQAIQALGNDYRQSKTEDGRTRYTWSWTRSTLVTTREPPGDPRSGSVERSRAVTVSCEVSLITDPDGQVTASRTTGSGCTRILGTDFWLP